MNKLLEKAWKGLIYLLKQEESFHPKVSRLEATGISLAILLIGFWVLFHTNYWWPGSILVIWFTLIVRQYLRSRWYELIITSIIYLCFFFSVWTELDWNLLMPILLTTAASFLFIREILVYRPFSEADKIRDDELEAERNTQKK